MSGELVEVLAETLSWASGDFTRYSPDAVDDHNRWSWRGDGHGQAMREEVTKQAEHLARAVQTHVDAAVAAARRDAFLAGMDEADRLRSEQVPATGGGS